MGSVSLRRAALSATALTAIWLSSCSSSKNEITPGVSDGGTRFDGDGAQTSLDAADRDDSGAGLCVTSPTPISVGTADCPVARPSSSDALDEALALAGTDRCHFGLDREQTQQSGWQYDDPRRPVDFDALMYTPLRLPSYGTETAKWLDGALGSDHPVSGALAAAAARLGTPVQRCADAAWYVIDNDAPLASAIFDASDPWGGGETVDDLRTAVAGVPRDLQIALAPVVRAIGQASLDVAAAAGTTDPNAIAQLNLLPAWLIGDVAIPLTPTFLALLDGVRVGAIVESAAIVARAIEEAKLSRFAGVSVPAVDVDTPFGAIVLRGADDDTYWPGSLAARSALVLDTGGNDVYRVPIAVGTSARPVSVAIDLGGDDLYGYVEAPVADDTGGNRLPSDGSGRWPDASQQPQPPHATRSRVPRQGAGILGVGMLFDLGTGADTYRSLSLSQGVGILGVGVLFDEAGDDTYTTELHSQAVGEWGIGLLLDRAGSDHYTTYHQAQGYGGPKGLGALVDLAGDDAYMADPGAAFHGDTLYEWAGGGDRNDSDAQGCGHGIRWDSTPEKVGFVGGIGLLRDAAGNDTYTAGTFAQGAGYEGVGMVLEGSGDDTYEGFSYVQGAGAHFGLGYLYDQSGNDRYNPTIATSGLTLGHGRDFAVGVHIDEGGDDAYHAGNFSLGTSDTNGVALFVNAGGNDSIACTSPVIGGAYSAPPGDPRANDYTFGVFVKAGGEASYTTAGRAQARSGTTWSYTSTGGFTAGGSSTGPLRSAGIDRPAGSVALP